jgi:hypothetical protein
MTTPDEARELRARQVLEAAETVELWRRKFERYHTTATRCDCPDWQFRGRRNEIEACAHMVALRLLEAHKAEAAQP